MKANELIQRLQGYVEKFGNVDVVYDYDGMDVDVVTVELMIDDSGKKPKKKIRVR